MLEKLLAAKVLEVQILHPAIAQSLVVTTRAVEKHVGSIFLKLGLPDESVVSRRVSAVLLYLGEAPPDSAAR